MNEKTDPVSVLALNPAVDISYTIPQLLEYQKVRAEQTLYHAGGNGINVARALNELGIPVNCCSIIAGESGDLLLKLLGDSLDGKHTWFRVDGETRINTNIVQQQPPGQYEISSIGPGVPTEILKEACDCLLEAAGKGIAVLSGQLPPCTPDTTYRELILQLKDQGARAVLDSHDIVLELALDAQPWMVRVNRHILEGMMHRRIDTVEDVAEAARSMQQSGIDYVCVTLGDVGAVLADSENCYHFEAPRIHKRSTVGCGDSMVTGMIAAAMKGETTQEMLRFGVRCASATAGHPGTELFTRHDLEAAFPDMDVAVLDR